MCNFCAASIFDGTSPSASAPQIQITEVVVREPINENHPFVVKLVSAGFAVEKCINAVNKYKTLDASLDYLEMDEGDRCETPAQFSREDSQDSFSMDW